jgi:hypothetical protein
MLHLLPPTPLKRLSKCASVTNPIGTGFFEIPKCDKHPLVVTLRKVGFHQCLQGFVTLAHLGKQACFF